MIRHRPTGSGHPYSADTEQRWPVQPIAGEPMRLGVRTSADVTAVDVEISIAGGQVITHALTPVARTSRGQSVDGGHLASAQARKAREAGGWQLELTDLSAHSELRYRFIARKTEGKTEKTRWYECTVARWETASDDLVKTMGHTGISKIPGSVQVLRDLTRAYRVRFALPLDEGERLTGFGERFDVLDHRGTQLDSVVFEQYKNQGAERKTYLPMPFAHVIGGTGWGFHVRTSRRVWFDLGKTDPDQLLIEAEVEAAADELQILNLSLYAGSPTQVLDSFLSEVGRPSPMPQWVFRLWASGNEWNTQAEVEKQMRLHEEHDIPVGSVVIEAWSDESTFTAFRDAQYKVAQDGAPLRLSDFEFPEDGAWPDPKGMVDALHAKDIKVHLWQIPLIKMRPHPTGQARADADAAIRENVLVRETAPDGSLRPYRNRGWWFPLGLMPDLTDDRAAQWWTEKRRYLVEDLGIDGFKTDGGEHAWGSDLVYLDGTKGDAGNNLFAVAYPAAYGKLLKSAGKAPVTFSRAGFTGSQPHGAFWAGDENSTWQAFRWSMLAGLSAAASGIVYWGWDIAGFSGDLPSAELYVRAMAASVFVPIMQYHSEFNHHRKPVRDRTPWNIAHQQNDPEVIPEVRELVHLRERLVPYLAQEAAKTLASSAPLMRPLYFEYPDDENVWKHPIQWFLGDDLLVSPVVEESVDEWSTYLPPGSWIDVWSEENLAGGQVVTTKIARDRIPVFARAQTWQEMRPIFHP